LFDADGDMTELGGMVVAMANGEWEGKRMDSLQSEGSTFQEVRSSE
jgi:hypothetical protein